MVASTLSAETRKSAYRYGGEEFCVIYEKIDAKKAEDLANQLRQKIADRKFHLRATRASSGKKRKSDKTSLIARILKKKKPTKKSRESRSIEVNISIGLATPDSVARDQ